MTRKAPPSTNKYDKIIHKTRVALHRECKKAKIYAMRKVIQKLKQLRNQDANVNTEVTKQLEKHEHKFDLLKATKIEDIETAVLVKTRFTDTFSGSSSIKMRAPSDEEQELLKRLLTYKELKLLMQLMNKLVETEERAQEKKARKALYRQQIREPMTSTFVASLSGRADNEIEQDFASREEDDIAAFLGEVSDKKKNRPGQVARRQRAIRREETEGSKYGSQNRPRRENVFPKKSPHVSRSGREKINSKYAPYTKQTQDLQSPQGPQRSTNKSQKVKKSNRPHKTEDSQTVSHPSWEAKRALKDKEKVDFNAVKPKKIRFTDE